MNYQDYLKSDHWRATRSAAVARAGNKCQVCSSTDKLEVHHNTYARVWNELDTDLVVLCHECHDLFTNHFRLQVMERVSDKESEPAPLMYPIIDLDSPEAREKLTQYTVKLRELDRNATLARNEKRWNDVSLFQQERNALRDDMRIYFYGES